MRDDRDKARGPSDHDPYYVLAATPLADERSRVLKHGNTFAVFNHHGDIQPVGLCEQGLYHEGTRGGGQRPSGSRPAPWPTALTRPSGAKTSAPTFWPWTAPSAPAVCGPRTPATA
jgi:hypothetical protein